MNYKRNGMDTKNNQYHVFHSIWMFLVHEMVAKKTQKNHDSRSPLPPYLGLFPKFYQFFYDFPHDNLFFLYKT